jgi:hypothetical protein
MDRLEGGEDTATRLVEHSPQLPQGFTPIGDLAIWPGAPRRRNVGASGRHSMIVPSGRVAGCRSRAEASARPQYHSMTSVAGCVPWPSGGRTCRRSRDREVGAASQCRRAYHNPFRVGTLVLAMLSALSTVSRSCAVCRLPRFPRSTGARSDGAAAPPRQATGSRRRATTTPRSAQRSRPPAPRTTMRCATCT